MILTQKMGTIDSHTTVALEEWVAALAVLAATIIITGTTRSLLKRLHNDHNLPVLRELAPTISNILYIVGLRLATDLAPLSGKVETWIHNGIYVLAVFIFLNLVQRAALLGIKWSAIRSHNTETLQQGFLPLLRNVITLFVFLSGGIMILKHFNYDVMSLLTALGVGSLAVGLAAKDTLSNMISGFILIIDRNLTPGDRVNLSGSVGDVMEIGLRSTQIRMTDGNTLIVPNSDLVNTKILNLSLPTKEVACTVQLRVPLSAPFKKIKELCLITLKQLHQVSEFKTGWVQIASLADGHQLIQVGFWIKEFAVSGQVTSDFHELILDRLEQEGIPLLPPSPPFQTALRQ
jgi:MscS family membrane protein